MKNVKFNRKEETKGFSPEWENKKRQFRQKFKINKEKLNEKDILQIMTSLELEKNDTIDVKEQSKNLLNTLDSNNDGLVETSDLIEEIMIRNLDQIEDEFTTFYKKINEYLHTKSEDIILKLKNLQKKEWIKNNGELNEKIESIITIISEEN